MPKISKKRMIIHPIADFVSRKHGLMRDPSLFQENEVSHWTVYNKVKIVLFSQKKILLKWLFREIFRPKIPLKNCQTIT